MLRRDLLKCLSFIPVIGKLCLGENIRAEVDKIGEPTKVQIFQYGTVKIPIHDKIPENYIGLPVYYGDQGLMTLEPTDVLIGHLSPKQPDDVKYCHVDLGRI
jgi:hypothetical protein